MTDVTIFEWAGGAEAFERLTHSFYARVVKDDLLADLFADMDSDHPHRVAAFLGEVFGGPDNYSRERGGHATMAAAHLGKAITEQQRRRWVELLMDAADEAGLPKDPEFRAVFAYYVEWGTRMALVYSAPDAPSVKGPMPRWDWGKTPPWVPKG